MLPRCTAGGGWSVGGCHSVVGCHDCSLFRFSLSGYMLSLRTGRETPSFFILAIKVVRFSPSRAAAPPDPPITQPASRNACKIRARVESLNVPGEEVTVSGFLSDTGRGFVTAFLSDVGSGFGSTPLFDRMTARSIKFWSSRTLPGQG